MRLLWLLLWLGLARLSQGFDFFGLFGNDGSSKKSKHKEERQADDRQAQEYLYKFGYAAPSQILQSSPVSSKLDRVEETFKLAIKKFQEFAGISPSGVLDVKTRKKMAEPRCGMLDVQPLKISSEDGYKWPKTTLTYSIFTYSTDIPHDQVTQAIRKAFDTWASVTNLDFRELPNHNENADIKIKFASREHGDPWPFDGKSGVLAHATMPTSGMLHFDEDENWVFMDAEKIANYGYTDLYPVAIHEIGHVLGLEHSRTKNSIMAPFYQETVDDYGNYVMPKLSSYDIQSIQDLYGRRSSSFRPSGGLSSSGRGSDSDSWSSGWGSRTTTTSPRSSGGAGSSSGSGGGLFESLWSKWMGGGSSDRDRNRTPKEWSSWDRSGSSSSGRTSPKPEPDAGSSSWGSGSDGGSRSKPGRTSNGRGPNAGTSGCPAMVDAISPNPAGTVYLFSGSNVYELRGQQVTNVYQLRSLFPRGPIYVEAAYMNSRERTMVLFQSYKVYAFSYFAGRYSLDLSYPKSLPRTISFNPTGAITWNDGHQLLFSRGDDFATYDEYWNEVQKQDKVSRYFPGLPKGIRGGLSNSGSAVSVFQRDKVVQYDTVRKSVTGSAQSISTYLNC